jgi:MoaA/NifB/PqqE/SkfB family radical SAM enzyme
MRRDPVARLKDILKSPFYIIGGISYHLGGMLFTAKPRMVQFPVCDRCNAKCIMCNRWRKSTDTEISIEKIREVFRSNLFSRVEDVNLHGGEPTLRKDLADICGIIQDACPRLRRLWISTNGFGAERIEKRILEALDVLNLGRIDSLEVSVSIDGLEETHERIRGVKGGFKQSVETLQVLMRLKKNYPINISIGTVIQPLNLNQLDEIEDFARAMGVPISFQPLMTDEFFNIRKDARLNFSTEDRETLRRIIERKLVNGSSTTSFYWRDFLCMMDGAKRKSPCPFDRYVFSLYPTGEVLPCSRESWIVFGNVYEQSAERIWFSDESKEIRRRMKRDVCPTCSSYCGVEFSLQKEFFTYARDYVKNHLSSNTRNR